MGDVDIGALPKVVLHDHLDGGVRPETLLELAEEQGYSALPADDTDGLRRWFLQDDAGDLVKYLQAFDHVVALLQNEPALERVAYEAARDLHADGVVYAEIRFGPGLHLRRGLTRHAAIAAVVSGFRRAAAETGLAVGVIASAMREHTDSLEVAKAAADFAGRGVVGFDLAGPEAGFPPDLHRAACRLAAESGLGVTIHAGEHAGPDSIWRAIARCGADRIGHGARLIEDCIVEDGTVVELGELARVVRDRRKPLEICITSNIHTGIASDAARHPGRLLMEAGIVVTFNTDNRLMSGTSVSNELRIANEHLGVSQADLGIATLAALNAGFGPWPERARLIPQIEAAYGVGP